MTTGTGTGSGTETWLGTETGGGNGDDTGGKERAQQAASTAADEGKHVAGVVAEETKSVAGEAKDHARNLVSEARSQLQGQVDDQSRQQKDMLVGTLSTFGNDLASMAHNGSGLAADVAHQVAERASSLSRHLDAREPSELLDDVRRFARQRPGTFLLGALAAGVIVGRLARGTKDAIDAAEGAQDFSPRRTAVDPQCSRHHVGARQPRSADPADPAATTRPAATGYSSPPIGTGCRAPQRPGRRGADGISHPAQPTGLHAWSTRSGRRGRGDDRSLGQIVSDLSGDLSTLMKQEVELAKVELKSEVGKVGKGAGMLGGAGLSGWFVLLFLSLALMFLLDNWLPIEAAALITTGVWAVIGAVLALIGRKQLQQANPQLPKTQETLKEDVQWAKAQKS